MVHTHTTKTLIHSCALRENEKKKEDWMQEGVCAAHETQPAYVVLPLCAWIYE